MPRGWRMVPQVWAKNAFNGEGASKYGGRWNPVGVPVVYGAQALSLTALEILVHSRDRIIYSAFAFDFDEDLITRLRPADVPGDWTAEPPSKSTQQIGSAWALSARSAVLQVPSVIVPSEFNYLVNPLHPDFKRIAIRKPEDFAFDPRLL